MKKYLLILLVAIAIIETSCQKEEKLIVGTWEASSVSGTVADEYGNVIFSGTFPVSMVKLSIKMEFKKDNNYSYSFSFLNETDSGTGIYTVNDNILYIDGDTSNIQKLDKKELILDMDLAENRMTVTFKKM